MISQVKTGFRESGYPFRFKGRNGEVQAQSPSNNVVIFAFNRALFDG